MIEESRVIPRFQVWAAESMRLPFSKIANIGSEVSVFGWWWGEVVMS